MHGHRLRTQRDVLSERPGPPWLSGGSSASERQPISFWGLTAHLPFSSALPLHPPPGCVAVSMGTVLPALIGLLHAMTARAIAVCTRRRLRREEHTIGTLQAPSTAPAIEASVDLEPSVACPSDVAVSNHPPHFAIGQVAMMKHICTNRPCSMALTSPLQGIQSGLRWA